MFNTDDSFEFKHLRDDRPRGCTVNIKKNRHRSRDRTASFFLSMLSERFFSLLAGFISGVVKNPLVLGTYGCTDVRLVATA